MTSPRQATISKADRRIWEIDFLRGVLIIGMVIDHFMFFLGTFAGFYPEGSIPIWLQNVGSFSYAYWTNEFKLAIRYIGVMLFFFLTGISSKFSKSNLKRSMICTGFGVLLALVYMAYTLISGNDHFALFGVITCLGVSMFLYWAGKSIYTKVKKEETNWKWWSLGIGIVLSLTGFIVNLCISTQLRFGHIFLSMFGEYNPGQPNSLEPLTFGRAILTIIGFYRWGHDWLGLLPYLGFTFIGGFVGEHVYSKRKTIFFRKDPVKNVEFNRNAIRRTWLVNWLGAKTFIIYIIHPAIIVILLLIVFSISAGTLPSL